MKIFQSKAKGQVVAPPSKSMAHRYLICSALSKGTSVIKNLDLSEDIKATISCIKNFGVNTEIKDGLATICGGQDVVHWEQRIFNCNESGSTLRFFIPLAMLSDRLSIFTGSQTLMNRPLSVYEEICKSQNILMKFVNNQLQIQGKLKSGIFEIPGNISSQFVTGLLFALPLLDGDSKIILTDNIESKSYIDMTLQVQREFGVKINWINDRTLQIDGNQKYISTNCEVEGDYSNAAFFEALNTVGGEVEITGLNENSLQGDKIYLDYFKSLQTETPTIDISDCPDLGPILFVVAACHNGATFVGTKRLRIKESNRGQVMCQELAKFGVESHQDENRIVIKKSKLHAPTEMIYGHNDHRVVMSLSVLLSVLGGEIEGTEAVSKSFPDFFEKMKQIEIKIQER